MLRIIRVKASGVGQQRAEIAFSLYKPDAMGRKVLREVVETIGH